MKGEALKIYSDGSASRDYTYISDIVRAYGIMLSRVDELKGYMINVASGTNTEIKEIVEYIARKMNVAVEHVTPRPGEVSRFPADIFFCQKSGI